MPSIWAHTTSILDGDRPIMHRAYRVSVLALLALAGVAACRKKPKTQPQTTPTTPVQAEPTCNQACQDSIARVRAAEAERDRIARERAAASELERARAAARATLSATIYFDYDKSDLGDDARAGLDAKVPILTANPGIRIRIAGHTDSRGSDEYNLALGQRRAASAKRYLTDRGVDGGRIDIVSFGEERGTCSQEEESCWAKNRRDEFEITAGGENITVSTSR
jgi:peptidoglycan-associated lipoprotein